MSKTTAEGLRAQAGWLRALGEAQERRGALANAEEALATAEAALKAEGVKPPDYTGEGPALAGQARALLSGAGYAQRAEDEARQRAELGLAAR